MDHHINKLKGPTFKALSVLKPYLQYMNLTQRKQMIQSKVLSIPMYGLGLYVGQTEAVKSKITTVFMRAYREIYRQPLPMKTKNEFICKKIGCKTTRQLIIQEGLKFISRIVNTQTPPQIFKMLKFPRKPRKNALIQTTRTPRTIKCKRSIIYKTIRQFNSLHSSIKFLHPKLFKVAIEKRSIIEVPDD